MRKEITNIIKEWKDEAGVTGIIQVSAFPYKTLTICVDRPGLMIGLHGSLVNKYKEKLKKCYTGLEEIKFVETDRWYIK